ncbi:unannotated protein [freshwater metagenome]|uniref:Unannotated protein n=1 Tax=freshwater metagenome TaxID=449393 RepID=A0A6J7IEH7_9ZZZZ
MSSCHRSSTDTGSAAEPDTMSRRRRAPSDHRVRVEVSAASHAEMSREYTVGTAMKSVRSPEAMRSQTRIASKLPGDSQCAPTQRGVSVTFTRPCTW